MNLFEAAEADDPYGDVEDQGIDYHELAEQQQAEQAASAQQQPAPQMVKTGPSMMSKADVQRARQMQMKMAISSAVNKVISEEEAKLDSQMHKLSKMDDDELEELRAKRLEALRKKEVRRSKWLQNNHGRFHELTDQKEFFANVKSTKHVICLFYSKTSHWSKPLQEHLTLIAQKHLECKFLQIEAQHAPFLIERLNIWMMPTLVLAKDNKVSTQLRGLDWVAPNGKIDTIALEQKLFEYGFLAETYLALEKQSKEHAPSKHAMHAQDDDSEDDLFDD